MLYKNTPGLSRIKIITVESDSIAVYASKLWRYRGLILTFAQRDLKIKYAQTYFGIVWALLQPVPSVIIFSFFFGKLINVDTGALPYPVFALIGMIAWSYFTAMASGIGNSLIESQHILKKVFFPKMILPLAKVLFTGSDFLIALVLVILVMPIFGVIPGLQIFMLPVFLLFHVVCGLAVGIWISALTFRYRDTQHILPNLISFSIWLTPVFYPSTILPKQLAYLMYFNPMALVMEGYRFSLGGNQFPDSGYLMSVIVVLVTLATGLYYFSKVEDQIAEYI